MEYCIPDKEDCDPSAQLNFLELFLISICVSLAIHAAAFGAYRFSTRKKRRERYEAKLKEVREHQIRTMELHARARRVGLKDVSKSRAHEIHKAKLEKKKEEEDEEREHEKEIERRESQRRETERQESIKNRQRESSVEQFQEVQRNSVVQNDVEGGALPEGWQVYYNENNIPYYYNVNTGVTSWRHPNS